MSLTWLTRGRSWGFRFLSKPGDSDPLVAYEQAFSGYEDDQEVFHRSQDSVALRFQDPEGREDEAGRPITHDFVLTGDLAAGVNTFEQGISLVWPLVQDAYAQAYGLATPPSV